MHCKGNCGKEVKDSTEAINERWVLGRQHKQDWWCQECWADNWNGQPVPKPGPYSRDIVDIFKEEVDDDMRAIDEARKKRKKT